MTFFECFADESFLKHLGLTSKELSGGHSAGRSNVSKKMQKFPGVLGVIDEDPGAARDPYLKKILSLKPLYSDDYFQFFRENQGNRLLVIRPDLESLTIKLAEERNIDLSAKYSLSMDRTTLHTLLRIEKNFTKRQKFVEFLKDISDHNTLLKLKKVIKE